jgi:flagellar biosynthesis/type III secretory pathway protein FliH
MKTIADMLREEGIEEGIEQGMEQGIAQGIEQGIAQGKQQGIAESLLMMLDDKVVQIPEDMQKHIHQLDEQTLKSIIKNYDQINTLQDLRHYL